MEVKESIINTILRSAAYDYVIMGLDIKEVNRVSQNNNPGPYTIQIDNYRVFIKIENTSKGMIWKLTNA